MCLSILLQVELASLPRDGWKARRDGSDQSRVFIAGDHLDPVKPTPGVRIVVPDLRSVGPGEERSSLQGSSFAAVSGFPHGGTMLDQLFMGAVENLQWRATP